MVRWPGSGLIARYAQALQLNVKAGNLVVSGQRVASTGTTKRSTGPHLDFEVRLNGVPQDPARFLQATARRFLNGHRKPTTRGEAVLTPCFLRAPRQG
jgi:hypothetical protein